VVSPVGAVCLVVAVVIGAGIAALLVVGFVEGYRPAAVPASPVVVDDPEVTRRIPAEWVRQARDEGLRRRLAAERVAANFPPPVVRGVAPFIGGGRAGLVDRQRVTVALRKGGC